MKKLFVGFLVLLALASIGGGVIAVLERRGLVTLRRVPQVSLLPRRDFTRGDAVAIVNTDTSPGCFLLETRSLLDIGGTGWEPPERPSAGAERVWVPARSIVVRSCITKNVAAPCVEIFVAASGDLTDRCPLYLVLKKHDVDTFACAPLPTDPDLTLIDERDPPVSPK